MNSEYTVRSGDTLSAIAQRHQTTLSSLMRLNPEIENPDRIFPGQPLKIPAANEEQFSSCDVGSVAQEPSCSEEIVEVVHVTGADELILLTEAELAEWVEEEEFVCGPITEFYRKLDGLDEGETDSELGATEGEGQLLSEVQEEKERLINELEARSVLTTDMQSIPPITEIKRLAGNKHVTFVRSDKIANHPRRYPMASRDSERSKGWLTENGVDPAKLRDAIRSELNVKFNATLWEPDKNGALMTTLNKFYDEASWSIWGDAEARREAVDETGFDASAEAQFMRFAAGAAASGEFDPRKGKVHFQAKAEAQYALAQGKVGVEQAFPVNNRSEIRIPYRVGGWDGERRVASLGHFQAAINASLSGFAGASALIAGNVHVSTKDGLPTLKGIASRKSGQKAGGEAGVFAGIRGGCEVSGELRWKDVLTDKREWERLCRVGKKVEAALGAGAEAELRLLFSPETGKFYVNAHAGLVLGVGPSGSFLLEIETQKVIRMLHFVYNALMDVDFRYLELFDSNSSAFEWYQRISLYALGRGLSAVAAAEEFANSMATEIVRFVESFFVNRAREERGHELAYNVVVDLALAEDSVFRHSPPEVKGVVLDNILYDWWVTPNLWGDDDIKITAVKQIMETFQGWRDFEETVMRMNPEGFARQEDFDSNVERLFAFIGKNKADQRMFILGLQGQRAIAGRPVKMDPFNVCRICRIG
ncbi:peptidoglycan-binding protein LysM [Marinobacter sp. EhC06]|jgi:LysM repeat protein|uniref:LysM peptidoglycan-binding domain-containing protein n=1 Tax=Marinobacter TaxID=2742 RepID=UPI0007D91E2D|nr:MULTISPECIES: LysM domain-containing protein [unclassified Marinobacter]OAN93731.1 peptidoglycan-binding protein LysM [Marinobacter sp. EhC06]OAN94674.1 peptidoglycan-binding protein LysM [Marinobacter sp. EhN04]